MEPILLHRVASTAVMPLVMAGGGYAYYERAPQVPQTSCVSITTDVYPGGSSRTEVTTIQRFLINQGYMRGTATGNFGNITTSSLVRFQSDHGIPATGYADARTRTLISSLTCTTTYTTQPTPYYPTNPSYGYNTSDYCSTNAGRYDRDCNSQNNNYRYTYNQPQQYGGYPQGCTGYYDRSCYVNGQYIGPRTNNEYVYNGPGDTCYSFNGQWQGNCNDSSFNSYQPYNQSYNRNYNDTPYYDNAYSTDYSCYYDRECLARMEGRTY